MKALALTRRNALALAIVPLFFATPAVAGFDEGAAAYQRGDFKTAAREWAPLAEQGDGPAQAALGALYLAGKGVERDPGKAVELYRQAAEGGLAAAQAMLGALYARGRGGIEQDYAQAAQWYRKAADQGLSIAQVNLGYMYSIGQGVDEDHRQAVDWYRKAADQGNIIAQYNLGEIYREGRPGIPEDHAAALNWYRSAAEHGYPKAQASLGSMYALGMGVEKDLVRGYKWYELAAARGEKLAARNRNLIEEEMSPQQIANARRLARQWSPAAPEAAGESNGSK